MRCVFAIGVVAAAGSAAFGGTIFDNGGPFIGLAATAWFAEVGGQNQYSEVADDFTLQSGASTIRDIHWWGVYTSTTALPMDDFRITIYNDAAVAHAPGTVNTAVNVITLNRTMTTDVVTGLTVYKYDAVVSDIVLAPGVPYWLGISNNSSAVASQQWAWVASDPFAGNLWQYSDTNMSFTSRDDEAAFYLTDDVPAPGALAMAGVVGVIATRRRRAR